MEWMEWMVSTKSPLAPLGGTYNVLYQFNIIAKLFDCKTVSSDVQRLKSDEVTGHILKVYTGQWGSANVATATL